MQALNDIRLRPLTAQDVPVIAGLANNYKIWRYLRDRLPHPYSEQDAVAFVQLTQSETPACTFGIQYQGSLAGVTGLMLQNDIHRLSAEIGYWIGEPYWNKGIATVAVQLLAGYAFHTLRLRRLFAGVFETNPASARVLSKAGFTLETVARQAVIKEGQLLDEHRYVMLNPAPFTGL